MKGTTIDPKEKRVVCELTGMITVLSGSKDKKRTLRYDDINNITEIGHSYDTFVIHVGDKEERINIGPLDRFELLISITNVMNNDSHNILIAFNEKKNKYVIVSDGISDEILIAILPCKIFDILTRVLRHKFYLEVIGNDINFNKTELFIRDLYSILNVE